MLRLVLATAADVSTLVAFDEMAALASTGTGFSEEGRRTTVARYEAAIGSSSLEPLLFVDDGDGTDRTVIGATLLKHDRPAKPFSAATGETFLCDAGGKGVPIPRADMLDILEGHRPDIHLSYIKSFALAPQAREKGFGKAALALVTARARELGKNAIGFSTGAKNASMRRLMKDATCLVISRERDTFPEGEHLACILKI